MCKSILKKSFLALVASGFVLTQAAQAADMLEDAGVEDTQYTQVEYGTGWYLRGDLGAGFPDIDAYDSSGDFAPNFESFGSISVGAGYRVSDFFRAELGINHFGRINFDDSQSIDCGTEDHDGQALSPELDITGSCSNNIVGEGNATTFMVNGYVDLPTAGGLTPYVGAGVGLAHVSWDSLSYENECVGGANDCGRADATQAQYTTTSFTEEGIKVAGNLMAGLAYKLTDNAILDFGYRYTLITDFDGSELVGDPNNNGFNIGDLENHEVRVGLRYEIW